MLLLNILWVISWSYELSESYTCEILKNLEIDVFDGRERFFDG